MCPCRLYRTNRLGGSILTARIFTETVTVRRASLARLLLSLSLRSLPDVPARWFRSTGERQNYGQISDLFSHRLLLFLSGASVVWSHTRGSLPKESEGHVPRSSERSQPSVFTSSIEAKLDAERYGLSWYIGQCSYRFQQAHSAIISIRLIMLVASVSSQAAMAG